MNLKTLMFGCAAATMTCAAHGALVLDVQVAGGGKNTTVAGPGSVVSLDIYADPQGANGNVTDEGLKSVIGYLKSSNGGLLGNLSLSLASGFAGANSQAGNVQDLDGDGDSDVGGTNTAVISDWVYARTDDSPFMNGDRFLIATATFTVTGGTGSTAVNFFDRLPGNNGDGNWREDGSPKADLSFSGGVISTGAPVTIAVPEPASLSLLVLGGAALIRRRRSS